MPYSVARQAQYYREFRGMTNVELTLEPLFLTEELVDEYELPRKPADKRATDTRYGKFEERHGGKTGWSSWTPWRPCGRACWPRLCAMS